MRTILHTASIGLLLTTPVSGAAQNPPAPTSPRTLAELSATCARVSTLARPDDYQSIVEAATQEWERFGARTYSYKDAISEFRTVEADWVELGGGRFDSFRSAYTWGRVFSYWEAQGIDVLDISYKMKIGADGQPARDSEQQIRRDKVNLKAVLAQIRTSTSFTADQKEALRISAVRSSLVEQPWSAVFIVTMMRVAGLSESQFPQSIAHRTYMSSARKKSRGDATSMRYLACPPDAATRVKPGDLICNGRGATARGFDTLWRASEGYDSHCDIVVAIEQKGEKFEIHSIGGNVQDTVLKTRYRGTGTPSLANISPDKKWIAVLVLQKRTS